MGRIALAVAYDGSAFDSYARQPGRRTVEGELLRVLAEAEVLSDARAGRFASGSRTDARVSAAWNVVAFGTDSPARAVVAAGRRAPARLLLLSACEVPADFNPRHAQARTYAYLVPPEWDFRWSRARSAARVLEGEHDVTNFSRPEPHRNPRRRVDRIRYVARPGPARLEVTGPSFAWQQVRRIVAALRAVSDGDLSRADVEQALRVPGRRVDFGLASPEPLVLLGVEYAGLRFPPGPPGVRRALGRARQDAERASYLWATAGAASGPTTRR